MNTDNCWCFSSFGRGIENIFNFNRFHFHNGKWPVEKLGFSVIFLLL